MQRIFACVVALFAATGCVTVDDINDVFRRVDRVWQLDYQKTEDEFRYRVIDAPYDVVWLAVRKTFIDLGMPVQGGSLGAGVLVAENTAPAPLSLQEWTLVAKAENPRLQRIGGALLYLPDDPKDYVVALKAHVRAVKGKTFVLLDYALDNPKLRRSGFEPSRHAPATAVQYASAKFWSALSARLSEAKVPSPRKRSKQEIDA